jgi:para-nitrobenzyl esterase
VNLKPVLLAVVAGLLSLGAAPAEPAAVVRTHAGAVRGTVADDLRIFQGIPYAQARRWTPPAPVRPWGGVKAASDVGPACPQPADLPIAPPGDQSEDCLSLNVTTPAASGRNRRPVLVYLHGGSFNYGAGADHRPDDLVTRGDVVAVTVNYRLGPFGFLAVGPDAGNLGLADQQAALRWVRDDIAAFGGDPRNVTIMGQSPTSSPSGTPRGSPATPRRASRQARATCSSCRTSSPFATSRRRRNRTCATP